MSLPGEKRNEQCQLQREGKIISDLYSEEIQPEGQRHNCAEDGRGSEDGKAAERGPERNAEGEAFGGDARRRNSSNRISERIRRERRHGVEMQMQSATGELDVA